MNHSKPGLNAPFYQWIRQVRRAFEKQEELEKKLKFYEMKSIGCSAVSYDIVRVGSSMQNDEKALSWSCKIEEVKRDLAVAKKTIDEYNAFLAMLNPQEKIVLQAMIRNRYRVELIAKEMKVSRNRVYEMINGISCNHQALLDQQGCSLC
jgi:hypothetical protein